MLGDPHFVDKRLNGGGSVKLDTADRIRDFIGEMPFRRVFCWEVEAFLVLTGSKPWAVGYHSRCVSHRSWTVCVRGASPYLSTVDRVRGWMRTQVQPAERQDILAAVSEAMSCPAGAEPELPPDFGLQGVASMKGQVSFRLEDGRMLELGRNDSAFCHLDHAWASTVHAFQGRTVDNVIAAMEAGHPHLTTQKSFYIEISRARDRAELVTDDATRLREQLESATGERISALEGIADKEATLGKGTERAAETMERTPDPTGGTGRVPVPDAGIAGSHAAAERAPTQEKQVGMEIEL